MTTASFNVSIIDDNILENNEHIHIEIIISSLSCTVSISNPGQATIIIVDNDSKIIIHVCIYVVYVTFTAKLHLLPLCIHYAPSTKLRTSRLTVIVTIIVILILINQ